MKVEYIAALEVVKMALWYKKFTVEIGVMPSDAILLYYNNNGATALATKPRSHQKFKHIERQYHLIRNYLEKDNGEVKRVDFTDNAADLLTKPLGQQKFKAHLEKIKFRLIANWL